MITKILDMVFTYLYAIYENAIHRIYKWKYLLVICKNRHKKPYKLGDQEYRDRYLHIFKVIQRLYGSVTLARSAALPYG